MKKYFSSIGLALLFVFISVFFSFFTMFASTLLYIFVTAIISGMNNIPFEAPTNEVLEGIIADFTPYVMIASYILSMLTYFLIFKFSRLNIKEYIQKVKLSFTSYISYIFLTFFLIGINQIFLEYLSKLTFLADSFEFYEKSMSFLLTTNFYLILFLAGLIGPIFEELVFRGLVYGQLKKVFPTWLTIFVQAFLFGLIHFILIQSIYAFLLGVIFGYIYNKTKSIYATILIHIVFNSTGIILEHLNIILKDSHWYIGTIVSLLIYIGLTLHIKNTVEGDTFNPT